MRNSPDIPLTLGPKVGESLDPTDMLALAEFAEANKLPRYMRLPSYREVQDKLAAEERQRKLIQWQSTARKAGMQTYVTDWEISRFNGALDPHIREADCRKPKPVISGNTVSGAVSGIAVKREFKVGDKVRLVDNGGYLVSIGTEYTVDSVEMAGCHVRRGDGSADYWLHERLELIEPAKPIATLVREQQAAKADTDGWVEHDGGGIPPAIHAASAYEIRYGDGEVRSGGSPEAWIGWRHKDEERQHQIVAYRVIG